MTRDDGLTEAVRERISLALDSPDGIPSDPDLPGLLSTHPAAARYAREVVRVERWLAGWSVEGLSDAAFEAQHDAILARLDDALAGALDDDLEAPLFEDEAAASIHPPAPLAKVELKPVQRPSFVEIGPARVDPRSADPDVDFDDVTDEVAVPAGMAGQPGVVVRRVAPRAASPVVVPVAVAPAPEPPSDEPVEELTDREMPPRAKPEVDQGPKVVVASELGASVQPSVPKPRVIPPLVYVEEESTERVGAVAPARARLPRRTDEPTERLSVERIPRRRSRTAWLPVLGLAAVSVIGIRLAWDPGQDALLVAREPSAAAGAAPGLEATPAGGAVEQHAESSPTIVLPSPPLEPAASPAPAIGFEGEGDSVPADRAEAPAVVARTGPRARRAARPTATALAEPLADTAVDERAMHAGGIASAPASVGSARPASPAPTPSRMAEARVGRESSASLSRDEIQFTMRRMTPALTQCAAGRVGIADIDLVIQPTGIVTGATVGGDFGGTPEGSCIARALRAARFPRFDGEPMQIRYPFRFAP